MSKRTFTEAFNAEEQLSKIDQEIKDDQEELVQHYSKNSQQWKGILTMKVEEQEEEEEQGTRTRNRNKKRKTTISTSNKTKIIVLTYLGDIKDEEEPYHLQWTPTPASLSGWMNRNYQNKSKGKLRWDTMVISKETPLQPLIEGYFKEELEAKYPPDGRERLAKKIKGFMWRYPHESYRSNSTYLEEIIRVFKLHSFNGWQDVIGEVINKLGYPDQAPMKKLKESNTAGIRQVRKKVWNEMKNLEDPNHSSAVSILEALNQ